MPQAYNPGNASTPSIMRHDFGRVRAPRIERSTFIRPCGWIGNSKPFVNGEERENFQALYPWFVDEIYPGETVKLTAAIVARMATPLYPVMANIKAKLDWFFVPKRLLWDNWERFQGYRPTPTSSVDFEIPSLVHSAGTPEADLNFELHSVMDVMGLPCLVDIPVEHAPSCLEMRAYRRVWNEWYRAQDVQAEVANPTDDGPDTIAEHADLLFRNKRPDYFGSCLFAPQKGDAVDIPVGSFQDVPVIGTGKAFVLSDGTTPLGAVGTSGTQTLVWAAGGVGNNLGAAQLSGGNWGTTTPTGPSVGIPTTNNADNAMKALTSELEGVAITINQLRDSIVLQQILELDSRGGTRYVETLMTRWGVDAEDYRLQRSEYLGGSTHHVGMNAVPQTSEAGLTPQGNLAAFALAAGGGRQAEFVKTFKEHGVLLGIWSMTADQRYQQGMRRMWSRRTRRDHYEPLAANLGEQAVLNKELVFIDGGADAGDVFGYQERWAELRSGWNVVSGHMRSVSGTPLDAWHLAYDYASTPTLEDFMVDETPFSRVQAAQSLSDPDWLVDAYAEVVHSRPMPVNSIPGLLRL